MTSSTDLSFVGFVRQVLDALQAADVTYLVGGAVALWAWGEPRTTADLDLVIDLPVESMGALSLELETRHMLVPVDIMLDLLLED
jgi:tRNA nucleotidyltransferase/poly(A) polymerase